MSKLYTDITYSNRIRTNLKENQKDLYDNTFNQQHNTFIETNSAEPTNIETSSLGGINNSSSLKINKPPKNVETNELAKDIEIESSDEESEQRFEDEEIDDDYIDDEELFINDITHPVVDTNMKWKLVTLFKRLELKEIIG
ncbi:24732_t:CDS:2 [Dentiscutata erythropus]|uniref:24732_t:CDS:1 n=1 Tax=Dentiscutata erythropus TaxID=1348616 RepID=A0A9N9HZ89_9GLOM|nr:24732_t:CDS:2 [Dentiscutata erythropus]